MSSTPATPNEPLQEYVNNQATDVEVEDNDSESVHDPWDPDQIRIQTKTYSLHQLAEMIDDKDVDLAPDFQRKYVWTEAKQSALIESLLLGIPLPSFYFSEDPSGKLQVVDGVQRLTTIHRYYRGKFALGQLAYLDLHDKSVSALPPAMQRRLKSTQFVAHVIDPRTPYRVKFDVFKRINTGGTPLSAQEIRHCMSQARSRAFLARLVGLKEFREVMGATLLDHPRMADREIALRLIAFHVIPVERYRDYVTLDEYLGQVTDRIDRELGEDELETLVDRARTALRNAQLIFDTYAFRKWPLGSTRRNPINRTLVESWGTALATADSTAVAGTSDALRDLAQALMTNNADYVDSITGGTGDANKVEIRLRLAHEAVRELVG